MNDSLPLPFLSTGGLRPRALESALRSYGIGQGGKSVNLGIKSLHRFDFSARLGQVILVQDRQKSAIWTSPETLRASDVPRRLLFYTDADSQANPEANITMLKIEKDQNYV